MFNYEALEMVKVALNKIKQIYEICEKFGSAEQALQDELFGKPAIIQHIEAMDEQFQKIKVEVGEQQLVNYITEHHLYGIRSTRNISSHNYDRVSNILVEATILDDLPDLESRLHNILKDNAFVLAERVDGISFEKDDKESKIKKLDKKLQIYENLHSRIGTRISEIKAEREELADSIQKPKGPKQ